MVFAKIMGTDKTSKLTLVQNDPMLRAKSSLPDLIFQVLEYYQANLTSLLNDTLLEADQALLERLAHTHIREEVDSYNYTLTHLRQHRTRCVMRFKAHMAEQFIALFEKGPAKAKASEKDTSDQSQALQQDWSVISNTELDLVLTSEAIARRTYDNKALAIDAVNSCFEQVAQHDISQGELPIGPLSLLRCLLESSREAKFDDAGILVILQTAENTLLLKLAGAYDGTLKLFANHHIRPKPKVTPKKVTGKPKKSRVFEVIEGDNGHFTVNTGGGGDLDTGGMGTGGIATGGMGTGGTGYGLGPGVPPTGGSGGYAPIPEDVLSTILPMVDKVAQKTYERTHHHQKTVDTLLKLLDKKHLLSKLSSAHTQSLSTVKRAFAELQDANELSDTTHSLLDTLVPAFVKATLQEPVFLNREQSEGRELLKLISSMDFYWHGEEDNQSMAQAREVVEKLAHAKEASTEAFKEAVTEVKTLYKEEDRKSHMFEKRIETAEQGKAKTTQVKHQVLDEISGVIRHYKVEKDLSYLMQNAWRQVMFYDGLRFGLESNEWRSDVKTLVRLAKLNYYGIQWKNKIRLRLFFKKLFVEVKHSLVRIGINGFKLEKLTQAFSKAFDKIKKPSIKSKDEIITDEPRPSIPRESIRLNEQKENLTDFNQQNSEPPSDDPRVAKAFERIGQFERGQEFDLCIDGQMKRCRLAAIIDQTQSYIFVNCRGCKVAEYTRKALARQIASRNAVPVACDSLFDRILEKIISQHGNHEHTSAFA